MENIVVDLALMAVGVFAAVAALSASIGAADGGPNAPWAKVAFAAGVAIFLLGGGSLAARIIRFLMSIWR